jgi:hypothetical protein
MGGIRRTITSHPVAFGLVAGCLLVGLAVVIFWFEPQKLFVDERVDEPVPQAKAAIPQDAPRASGDDSADPSSKALTKTLSSGRFVPLNHDAKGKALILEVDGKRFLRFEEFEVENGPDLKVYLSNASSSSDPSTFDDDFVDLGELKGNIGSQNYQLPDGVDLETYRSAVVWCRRFSVGFAVADIGV